jgi:hypothetical protein
MAIIAILAGGYAYHRHDVTQLRETKHYEVKAIDGIPVATEQNPTNFTGGEAA